jgi:hypothetical protein
MSMTKDHKYYPCNNCRNKQIAGTTSCPFAKKSMCLLYQACDALVDLSEGKSQLHDIPVGLILDVLRNQGYSGELRQTRIVNI